MRRKLPISEMPRRFVDRLFEPVDIAWLVFFRISFAICMIVEVLRYQNLGIVERLYVQPTFHFSYPGFDWIRPWDGFGMHLHVALLGVCAVAMLAGTLYRLAAIVFFLGFAQLFLLDKAEYLNHFYLIGLFSFLLAWLPAHQAFSIDAATGRTRLSPSVPRWCLWLLRFQVGVPYAYAGVAKLNADWLQALPLKLWLAERAGNSDLLAVLREPWLAYAASYAGLAIDLLAVPLLLWSRTRLTMFICLVVFHLLNAFLFNIGIFPWLMIAATTVYFPPSWPRRLRRFRSLLPTYESAPRVLRRPLRPAVIAALAIYAAVQLLMPLRHWLYPGDVAWTEEGHRFSWRMKLRQKHGFVTFFATSSLTQRSWVVDVHKHLTDRQIEKMASQPDMVHQFCRYLATLFARAGYPDVAVRVHALVSLNGRARQLMIDPNVDLASTEPRFGSSSWILPATRVKSDRVKPGFVDTP